MGAFPFHYVNLVIISITIMFQLHTTSVFIFGCNTLHFFLTKIGLQSTDILVNKGKILIHRQYRQYKFIKTELGQNRFICVGLL